MAHCFSGAYMTTNWKWRFYLEYSFKFIEVKKNCDFILNSFLPYAFIPRIFRSLPQNRRYEMKVKSINVYFITILYSLWLVQMSNWLAVFYNIITFSKTFVLYRSNWILVSFKISINLIKIIFCPKSTLWIFLNFHSSLKQTSMHIFLTISGKVKCSIIYLVDVNQLRISEKFLQELSFIYFVLKKNHFLFFNSL